MTAVKEHERAFDQYMENLKRKADKNTELQKEVSQIADDGRKAVEEYLKSYGTFSKAQHKLEKNAKAYKFENIKIVLEEYIKKLESEIDAIKKRFKQDKNVQDFMDQYVKKQTLYNKAVFMFQKISRSQYEFGQIK